MVVPRPGELSRISAVAERLSSYFDDEPYYLWAVPNWLCNDGLHGVIDLFYPGVPLAISLHQRGGDDQKAWLNQQLQALECPHLVIPPGPLQLDQILVRLRDLVKVYPPHRTIRLLELLP